MNILVVAAHADDEVIGCGGTIARHAAQGDTVHILFLADGITSRGQGSKKQAIEKRNSCAKKASRILGANPPVFTEMPDNRMDSMPLLDIIKKVEPVISKTDPDVVYTHHGNDLNIDHQLTHRAVMTACRPVPGSRIKGIYSFEVLSSTDWMGKHAANQFCPDYFVDISEFFIRKTEALEAYSTELQPFPHARSVESVEALAKYRGGSVGMNAAEAFQVERQLLF